MVKKEWRECGKNERIKDECCKGEATDKKYIENQKVWVHRRRQMCMGVQGQPF
jgi:hypothetical protein